MSYDVSLMVDTGDEEPMQIWTLNYTSNVARMWRHAGLELRDLNCKPASECVEPITDAVAVMAKDPATYLEMNPENGWGNYEGCMRFLAEIAAACKRHPKTTLEIWS